MTNQHPITPPPELVEQWTIKGRHQNNCSPLDYAIAQCAQWSADQQLEACCENLKSIPSPLGIPFGAMASNALRNACRPEPPSLKEQALAILDGRFDYFDEAQKGIIRQALETLNDN